MPMTIGDAIKAGCVDCGAKGTPGAITNGVWTCDACIVKLLTPAPTQDDLGWFYQWMNGRTM